MIKLSLFILDPVKAHALYVKERDTLQFEILQPYIKEISRLTKLYERATKKRNKLDNEVKQLNNKLKVVLDD